MSHRDKKYSYRLESKDSYPIVEVKDIDWSKPEYICKYYSISERNICAAISRKIFVSSPDLLNDLFDTLFLKIAVDKSHINIYRELMTNVDLEIDEEKFNNSQQYRESLRNTLCAIWTSKTGILCTTDDTVNDLMWTHYTNNEGFLIQFNYNLFPENFGNPIPISYLTNEEFSEYMYSDVSFQLYVNSLLKKRTWKYENEYRFLVHPRVYKTFLTTGRFSNEDHYRYPKESRLQSYPKECVQKIILGFNFFKSLYVGYNKVDFGKPDGLLKKTLIDFANKENIDLEVLLMNHKKMILEARRFQMKKVDELIFEIKYAS